MDAIEFMDEGVQAQVSIQAVYQSFRVSVEPEELLRLFRMQDQTSADQDADERLSRHIAYWSNLHGLSRQLNLWTSASWVPTIA